MNVPAKWLASLSALLLLDCALASAGELYIRLVDANAKAPLEFWQNDSPLPHGGKMLYRMPARIYVDGKAFEFEHYGLKTDSAEEEPAKDKQTDLGDELVKEMGGGPFSSSPPASVSNTVISTILHGISGICLRA